MGDTGLIENLGYGDLRVHDPVVGGGEHGVNPANQGSGGGDDLIGGVAGLFQIGNALLVQIFLGLGNGGDGVILGVAEEQTHGLDVGVDGQHHVQDEGGVQGVGGAGDVIQTGEARGFGVGAGGVDDGGAGALGGGDHGLGGERCDGDDHVHLVIQGLSADLTQHGGVVLAVVIGDGQLHTGGFGSGLQLGGDGLVNFIQGGMGQLLDDGYGVALDFGGFGSGLSGYGGRGSSGRGSGGGGSGGSTAADQQGSGQNQGRNDSSDFFHKNTPFQVQK